MSGVPSARLIVFVDKLPGKCSSLAVVGRLTNNNRVSAKVLLHFK